MIPNIEETHNTREEFLHLLDQVVQHTPLKIEETAGTDYDRGYIFYQDMVLRDVEELETTMWEWHHQQLQKAREEAQAEYKQFVLNVLDGVDIADGQCNTKAIRFALESRIIQSELDQDNN